MWLLAFLILALGSSGGANSVNVYFESENFRNVLHWDPLDSPDNQTVVYSVEYNEYGDPFKPKMGCQNITALFCDLTQETIPPSLSRKYAAQVMVGGKKIGETTRFCPFTDSVLGPPNVSVTLDASVMTVRVDLPMSLGEMMASPPVYALILTHNTSGGTITKEYKNTSAVFTISNLQSGTKYCGSVTYNTDEVQRREPSKASTFCKTLRGDVEEVPFLFLLPVGIVLLLIVLILMIVLILWRLLMMKKVAEPESLNVTSSASPPLAADEKNTISRIWLQPEKAIIGEKEAGFTYKKKQESSGYAPQDNLEQPWHCQTYTTQQAAPPEEPHNSALSSPNYCLVMVHNSSEDESSPVTGTPGGGNFSKSKQPLAPVTDLHQISGAANRGPGSPEPETLMLQISPEGRLKLPFLYQPTGLNGKHDPEEESSEREALLSDQPEAKGMEDQALFHPQLSGLTVYCPQEVSEMCTTNTCISNDQVVPPSPPVPPSSQGQTSYLPIQPHICTVPMVSEIQSAYRQNWIPLRVPEISTGPQSTWFNQAEFENQEELGDEEDEELNAGKGIFLKGWMLQIQS